jgi:ABC-type multidrug transport system ATPase subunit
MPEGYSTQIGTAAQPLSGGQIQRLGLARAIYGTPRLIVLDEPNSNLDGQGDEALTAAIRTMRERGSVVVVMAHRPSAIIAVNKVMIMHRGTILQFGNKEEVVRPAPTKGNTSGPPSPRAPEKAAAPGAPSSPDKPAPSSMPISLALAARAKMLPAATIDPSPPAAEGFPPDLPAAEPAPGPADDSKKIGHPG